MKTLIAAAVASLTVAACGPNATTPPVSAPTSAQAPTANDTVRLVLDPSASQAKYHAHEQLVGRTLPNDAVGTSTAVSGTLVLAADSSVKPDQSQIQVDLRQLKSDEARRDNFVRGDTLQTNSFPMATFVPREVQGLPTPLPMSGQATFQLVGDLTVHGVTRPVTWQVNAEFSDATVAGNATTDVKIDFAVSDSPTRPRLSGRTVAAQRFRRSGAVAQLGMQRGPLRDATACDFALFQLPSDGRGGCGS